MTTVRQVERQWQAGNWELLLRKLLSERPENSPQLQSQLHSRAACAALIMIRLDELSQAHLPLFTKLLQKLIAWQDRDGGWRDPLTTSLCLRALLIDGGRGLVIDRAMQYLASMQKDEGIWPKIPIRRMAADAFTSAFVLFQLVESAQFRRTVRFAEAVRWFELNENLLDAPARWLWRSVRPLARRCQSSAARSVQWS